MRPGKKKDALLLILFSLFSNKQGQCVCTVCVCVRVWLRGLQTNDEYAETLRDISEL